MEKRAQTSTACPTATSGYTGTIQASLAYDPLGRLAETSVGGTGITRFLYDGDRLAAEYNGAGAMVRRYAWGPGVDEPVLADEGAALSCSGTTTKFLHADQRGSIVALADCSGNRSSINAYDEYGIPGSSNLGRFQYTGQMWIPEIGMYYYKARIYSPTLGRFLQTDQIEYEDQINLYVYVANDPINITDPTGMAGCSDMASQELSGVCFDASNFNEKKANSSLNIVANAENDAAVEAAGPAYAVNGAERGFRVDGSAVTPAGTAGERGGTSTVQFDESELEGADAFGHSHAEDVKASKDGRALGSGPGTDGANPGPMDGAAVIQVNKPLYITHQGRTIVIEVSGGQARVRVVGGVLTTTEIRKISSRLRAMQRIIQ